MAMADVPAHRVIAAYYGRRVIPLKDVIPPRTTPVVAPLLLAGGVLGIMLQGDGTSQSWLQMVTAAWALIVFADNVEDRLGRLRFAGWYVVCAVVATIGRVAVTGGEPAVSFLTPGGAAAVLGAYVMIFRGSQVLVWVPVGLDLHEVPAALVAALLVVLHLPLGPPALLEVGLGFVAGAGLAWVLHPRFEWADRSVKATTSP